MKNERRSNEERTGATRAALISAARKLFVEKGYADTGTPEIVTAAGMTRGALYHHFGDKQGLFREVVTREYAAVAAEIEAGSKASVSLRQALIDGGVAYIRAMAVPGRVRLMLLDGPVVLGREGIGEIDTETSEGTLREGLAAAIEAGEIAPLPLGALTAQLSAMFDCAALCVAAGDDPADHRAVFEMVFASIGKRAQ